MLKSWFILANQTTLTLVMMKVPRLPWSEDRFHTPSTVLTIVSWGRILNWPSDKIALRSFSSRYSLDEVYALL